MPQGRCHQSCRERSKSSKVAKLEDKQAEHVVKKQEHKVNKQEQKAAKQQKEDKQAKHVVKKEATAVNKQEQKAAKKQQKEDKQAKHVAKKEATAVNKQEQKAAKQQNQHVATKQEQKVAIQEAQEGKQQQAKLAVKMQQQKVSAQEAKAAAEEQKVRREAATPAIAYSSSSYSSSSYSSGSVESAASAVRQMKEAQKQAQSQEDLQKQRITNKSQKKQIKSQKQQIKSQKKHIQQQQEKQQVEQQQEHQQERQQIEQQQEHQQEKQQEHQKQEVEHCLPNETLRTVHVLSDKPTACGKWYAGQMKMEGLTAKKSQLTFHPDSTKLTTQGNAVLKEVALALKAHPKVSLSVTGESPIAGQRGKTLALGRAKEVLAHLEKLAVHNKLSARGINNASQMKVDLEFSDVGKKPDGCTLEKRYLATRIPKLVCVPKSSGAQQWAEEKKELQHKWGILLKEKQAIERAVRLATSQNARNALREEEASYERRYKMLVAQLLRDKIQMGSPVPLCQDEHPRCKLWKKLNFCGRRNIFVEKKLLRDVCRKSCNRCGSVGGDKQQTGSVSKQLKSNAAPCHDVLASHVCKRYKDMKFCKHPVWEGKHKVVDLCSKTCGTCRKLPAKVSLTDYKKQVQEHQQNEKLWGCVNQVSHCDVWEDKFCSPAYRFQGVPVSKVCPKNCGTCTYAQLRYTAEKASNEAYSKQSVSQRRYVRAVDNDGYFD